MLSAMRYRIGQALVIALLSALIAACAAFAPLYDRAMQQAAVDVTLANASTLERDLQLYGSEAIYAGERMDPAALADLIPGDLFGPVVEGRNATAKLGAAGPAGELWWRAGQCDHIEITAGSCPDEPRQILVTDNDSKTYDIAVGDAVTGPAAKPLSTDEGASPAPMVSFDVVGTYRPADAEWWQGLQLDGIAGVASSDTPRHDTWLTDASTFAGSTPFLDSERAWVGTRLRTGAIGVEELAGLDTDIRALQRRAEVESGSESVDPELWITSMVTELPAMADEVNAQIEQSRTTVPLLLVQLGLLGVIVLWLMLLAATDQRRPEVVIARLRGLGTPGARSLLMRELLPPVLIGIVPGVLVALGGAGLVRAYVLPGNPPFELPRGLVLALIIAAATLTLVTYAAAARIAREPLGALLHRTSGRRPGWRLGAGDAVAIAATGACVVAFVTGSLTGPIALAAPALLSVMVGLVLAHLFAPVAVRLGRALLTRGRLLSGVPLLEAARNTATRHTVTLVTVAAALAVFSVCGVMVGDHNRELAAEQEAGAALVAELHSAETTVTQLERVQQTLATIDPDSRRVTPVVRAVAPSGAAMTLAVDPEAFHRIALFTPGMEPSERAWSALSDGSGREPVATIGAGAIAAEKNPTIIGLDGIEQEGERVGTVDRIPGGIRDLALVDLDTARELAPPDGDSSVSLWFAEEDPTLLAKVTDALSAQDVLVGETRTVSDARLRLDESVATWSLWLGALVGQAAVVIALLGLSVLSVTGWRTRARDLASLAMAGVGRRTVNRLPGAAQLVPVAVGVLAGAGCGLLGMVLTMPDVPLFAVPPDVDATDLSIPWAAAAMTAGACFLVLGATAAALGRAVAASARLDRLRESA
ncbi:FtsX-like permease family protein [Nocardioides sp. NPDC023903]|uniref:FtsX-like permease family protein n=1 Tax=Nocardioides sp. NPDC023903 TaxID=3157195 RepID=UPI00340F5515